MHRMTPLNTAFRSYTAGGARTTVDKVDDSKLMQASKNFGMHSEMRDNVESPQNYGFTSVVMPADKDKDGKIEASAEGYLNFLGGSRSLPVCTMMDDRRHRLKDCKPGDSAMFRTKDDRQQFHMDETGNFVSCRDDRCNRIALVPKPSDDQQKPPGEGGPRTSPQQDKQQKPKATGQQPALDDNKKSEMYFEQNGQVTTVRHSSAYSAQRGSDSSTFYEDRKKSTQVTAEHSHLRTAEMRIFTDESGCWSEVPILVKKDKYCKE